MRALCRPRRTRRYGHPLKALHGRFIQSINDVPEIRELFAEFDKNGVELTYTVVGESNATKAKGLVSRVG